MNFIKSILQCFSPIPIKRTKLIDVKNFSDYYNYRIQESEYGTLGDFEEEWKVVYPTGEKTLSSYVIHKRNVIGYWNSKTYEEKLNLAFLEYKFLIEFPNPPKKETKEQSTQIDDEIKTPIPYTPHTSPTPYNIEASLNKLSLKDSEIVSEPSQSLVGLRRSLRIKTSGLSQFSKSF